MIYIAILGHGVVGSGVAELLIKNADRIEASAGQKICVKKILDIRDFPGLSYSGLFTKDYNEILQDQEISIVAEMMGGLSPAFDFVKSALESGKSVVTSNKELVAVKGAELLRIAKEHHVNFFFEASVAGGIPVINPLHTCLGGNHICSIHGILNGTTNYILTKMVNSSSSFEEALKEAQVLGYAERDPSADVDGLDACRKICILASLAYGRHIDPKEVYTEGIRNIDLEDIRYAEVAQGAVKLICSAEKVSDGKVDISVRPCIVRKGHPLFSIGDVYNGIVINGDAVDDVLFVGKGAGKFPTASAVVGDIIDIAQHPETSVSLTWEESKESSVADYRQTVSDFYVRTDSPVEQLFSEVDVLKKWDQTAHPAYLIKNITEEQLDGKLQQVDVLSKIRLL